LLVSPTQPQRTRRQKGDGNDILEHGLVAVPADGGAGRIFGDQDLLQALRRNAREVRRTLPQRQEQPGNFFARAEGPSRVIEAPAEGHDPSPPAEPAKGERLKRQHREPFGQRALLLVGYQLLPIAESFRPRLRPEQLALERALVILSSLGAKVTTHSSSDRASPQATRRWGDRCMPECAGW
jgi:hypothetical protein